MTVVLHPQVGPAAGRAARRHARRSSHVRQPDLDLARRAPHRMPGIGAQVDQYLLDLAGVHGGPFRLGSQPGLQPHTGRQGGAQQRHRLVDQRGQRLAHRLVRLAPAEGQNLMHQVAGPQGRLAHMGQPRRSVGGRHTGLRGQRQVAQHGAEDVVEIMRNAASQRAQRLHLLRFAQRIVGALALDGDGRQAGGFGHCGQCLVGGLGHHALVDAEGAQNRAAVAQDRL